MLFWISLGHIGCGMRQITLMMTMLLAIILEREVMAMVMVEMMRGKVLIGFRLLQADNFKRNSKVVNK